jgi:tetratricopeptide (TPR) repeat protein
MAYSSVERPLFAEDDPEHMGSEVLPSEAQLILLCLDYLRDLRRSYSKEDLRDAEGINADYLSVSIYALSRCFLQPPELTNEMGNDNLMDRNKANRLTPGLFPVRDPVSSKNYISIPNLSTINKEILYSENPAVLDNEAEFKNQDPSSWYQYDNAHISNAHRFYPLEGLAAGIPFSLGEITTAGLAGLGARCRGDVDEEIKESPLFDQFASAVRAKGFFRDPETETPRKNPEEEKARLIRAREVEEERFQKVVDKFRFKLAAKAQQQLDDGEDEGPPLFYDTFVMSAGERLEQRRQARMEAAQIKRNGAEAPNPPPPTPEEWSEKPRLSIVTSLATKFFTEDTTMAAESSTPPDTRSGRPFKDVTQEATPLSAPHASRSVKYPSPSQDVVSPMHDDPLDIEEAERLKSAGNGHMQKKEFAEAAKAYPEELLLSPNGPNTHLYYSNRAPTLLSMKKMEEPVIVTSLATKFFTGDTPMAAESLTPRDTRSGRPFKDVTQEATPLSAPNASRSVKYPSPLQGVVSPMHDDPLDIEEAERLKSAGNGHMQKKEFAKAAKAYTEALLLSPNGPNTHVYYSNRAAALLSMKKMEEAVVDSEKSLALKPDYGKAHARLGLAHFLLGNYQEAMESYTLGLKYDPGNKSTMNYLEKASKRLAAQEKAAQDNGVGPSAARSSPPSYREEGLDEQMKTDEQRELTSQKEAKQRKRESEKIEKEAKERKKESEKIEKEAKERKKESEKLEKEAEKFKLVGNTQMANRDYQGALDAYSAALKLCSDGPNSHVYFSNRAAALCYLERYEEAEKDSEMSLALVPTYGKAHARLGLSRFFMSDYSGAIEAYAAALTYDPDNTASKSYLAKARARLARENETTAASESRQTSV